MKLTQKQIKDFQKEILSWYKKNKRDLPWRQDRDSYHILISEVMLQQTQVSRVTPKYEAWMKQFPNIASLALASTKDVLRLWSGLGYNRRALYLKKCAETLVNSSRFTVHSKMEWPRTERELVKLPGIGKYTARAIMCFAFGQEIAVVDTNIRKVILIRFENEDLNEKEVQEVADVLLPKGRAYEWNQALMDYSSAVLKREKISIPKQSRFKGSNRYYRGQILKLLLQESLSEKALLEKFTSQHVSQEHLEKILQTLLKDGLITFSKDTYHILE